MGQIDIDWFQMGFRSQDALLLVSSDPCTQSSFKCWRWQAGGADTFQEALQPLLRALLTIRHLLYSWQWSSTIVLNVKSKKCNCNHKGPSPSAPSSIHGNSQVQVHHGWCVLGLVLSILYAQYSILPYSVHDIATAQVHSWRLPSTA